MLAKNAAHELVAGLRMKKTSGNQPFYFAVPCVLPLFETHRPTSANTLSSHAPQFSSHPSSKLHGLSDGAIILKVFLRRSPKVGRLQIRQLGFRKDMFLAVRTKDDHRQISLEWGPAQVLKKETKWWPWLGPAVGTDFRSGIITPQMKDEGSSWWVLQWKRFQVITQIPYTSHDPGQVTICLRF